MQTVVSSGAVFKAAGSGPSVLCLHSSASSWVQFRLLMDRLAPRFRVIAPDFYGYGQSPPWPGTSRFTLADELALLGPALEAAGESFHLVGHSYGGAVALKLALAMPERVRSLTVFEPVLFSLLFQEDATQPGAREIRALGEQTTSAVARGDLAAAGQAFVDYWMGEGSWSAMPEKRRAGIEPGMRKVNVEWGALVNDPARLTDFATLEIETRFLLGGRSPASTHALARLLTSVLPHVDLVELDDLGHMGPVTHPDIVNTAIEAFVTRMDAASGSGL